MTASSADPGILKRIFHHPATPRLGLLALLLAAAWAVAAATGFADDLTVDKVRKMVRDAGAWGYVVYVTVFTVAEFAHIPGMVFVVAGVAIWGPWIGGTLGFFAANVSICVTFLIVRGVGGKALQQFDHKWIKKALDHLDARPLITVTALRSVFWLAPALNYALALSNVRFRWFALGSAIGLILPVTGVTLLFDFVLKWLEG